MLAGVALAVLAVVAGALVLNGVTGTSAQDGAEMRLIVEDGGVCSGDTCSVHLGGGFTLAVEIVSGPPGGYVLAQSWVDFGTDLVYQPAELAADEVFMEDCSPNIILRDQAGPSYVNHGCITGIVPPLPVSNYRGVFAALEFTCSTSPSTTEVKLLPNGDPVARTNGALFSQSDNTQITPAVRNVTVECKAGVTAPPHQRRTPIRRPTVPFDESSVTPGPPGGDANCDDMVDREDAMLALRFKAELIDALECQATADVNLDGVIDAIDAQLILQSEAS
jgi:hypothetical protein